MRKKAVRAATRDLFSSFSCSVAALAKSAAVKEPGQACGREERAGDDTDRIREGVEDHSSDVRANHQERFRTRSGRAPNEDCSPQHGKLMIEYLRACHISVRSNMLNLLLEAYLFHLDLQAHGTVTVLLSSGQLSTCFEFSSFTFHWN